jgi:hypothetical protein
MRDREKVALAGATSGTLDLADTKNGSPSAQRVNHDKNSGLRFLVLHKFKDRYITFHICGRNYIYANC